MCAFAISARAPAGDVNDRLQINAAAADDGVVHDETSGQRTGRTLRSAVFCNSGRSLLLPPRKRHRYQRAGDSQQGRNQLIHAVHAVQKQRTMCAGALFFA